MFKSKLLQLTSKGELSVWYLLFLILILPSHVKASPVLPDLVGNTPLDQNCNNLNLNKYSKNYLNHLFNSNEILASMLLTLHNINFYQELMALIRKNINEGTFDKFHDKYIDKL